MKSPAAQFIENILNGFAAPGSHLNELINQIGDKLNEIDDRLEVCAFTDHQNGLGVLRYGHKPTKSQRMKQSFALPMEWNKWEEEKGVGGKIVRARLIVQGEITEEAANFLNTLRDITEDRNKNIVKQTSPSLWGNRESTQVKWGIVAAGEKSHRLLSDIELFADSRMPVLITGETGCGKELVASALHAASTRKGRFFAVNCAAIPKELIESELFGHKKGAYTGATDSREGYFQAANEGTLFLDEIGELSLDLQAKLLRVLQESKVRRVGSNIDEPVKIRVVAATNRDLAEMVKAGEFRADLFYRLHGLNVKIAPLRDRAEEIPQLIEFLLKKLSEELGRDIKIDDMALRRLLKHNFPGNVRELVNLLEAGAVYAKDNVIKFEHLRINGEVEELIPELLINNEQEVKEIVGEFVGNSAEENLIRIFEGKTFEEIQEEVSKIFFTHALDEHNGQINRAAASLGMERSTFSRQVKRMGLLGKEYKTEEVRELNLNLKPMGSSIQNNALAA